MLPKASQRVGRVVKLANKVARRFDREYVGTEHLLLAIQEEGTGVGAAVLSKNKITPKALRAEIDNLVKKSLEETWVFGRLPGTPHFRNVVAAAVEQCQRLGAEELCTEHVLLALLKQEGCVACRALTNLGLDFDKARKTVLAMQSSGEPG